jgi:hypothetical protein
LTNVNFNGRRRMKNLLIDCDACGGPMPAGRACPHCDAAPKATSLRKALLALALGAGSSMVLMACYGIAPCNPKTFEEPGYTCSCDSSGVCSPQCNPATFPADGGSYNAVTGQTDLTVCSCTDGGFCSVVAVSPPDGGADGGVDAGVDAG